MLFNRFTGNENVVHKIMNVVETFKNVGHETVEGLRRIPEAKGHSQKLIKAKGRNYSSFWNVLRGHRKVHKSGQDVYFRKNMLPSEFVRHVRRTPHWVLIRCCFRVEDPVVATRT